MLAGNILMKRKTHESRQLNLMTVPVVIWYALFCYLPLFGVAFAFKDFTPKPGRSLFYNLFVNSPWVGFRNFYIFVQESAEPCDHTQHTCIQYSISCCRYCYSGCIGYPVIRGSWKAFFRDRSNDPCFAIFPVMGYCGILCIRFSCNGSRSDQFNPAIFREIGCPMVSVPSVLEVHTYSCRYMEELRVFTDNISVCVNLR